jgi:hypothetical protein
MSGQYKTSGEILTVVKGFEKCTTDKAGFKHVSHLTVAAYYLCHSTADETFQKMRLGLLRFLNHHAIDIARYDEQLTQRWIRQIQSFIEQMDSNRSLVETVNAVVERFGTTQLPRE